MFYPFKRVLFSPAESGVVVFLANVLLVDYGQWVICGHFYRGLVLCRHFVGCEDLMFWSISESWVATVGLLFWPIFCMFLRC